MQIDFGQKVKANDGKAVGSVVGLVLNGDTFEVTRILVGHGRGEPPRLVDVSVAQAGGDGAIALDMPVASFEATPRLASREAVTEPDMPVFPTIIPASGVGGPVLADSSDSGPGYPGGGFFDIAPIDPPVVQVESNLLFSEVVLHHGSDVIASDGDKVGTVDEASFGDLGVIAGIVVRAGFLFHHDLHLPVADLASFETNRVNLKLTKEEAELRRA